MQIFRLSLLVVFFSFLSFEIKSQSIHLLLVCDTDDYTIGKGVSKNVSIVASDISKIAKKINFKLFEHNLIGNNFTISKINKIISNLKVQANDIVLFYYSGHGINGQSNWPLLLISNGSLDLEKIHKKLKSKNPRFLMTFADCCNYSNTYNSNSKGKNINSEKIKTNATKSLNLLFSDFRGDIIACGSKTGFSSYNDFIGGFYTVSFFIVLNRALKSKINSDWQTIFETTSDFTKQNAQSVGKIQEPFFEINTLNLTNEQIIYHSVVEKETLSSIGRLYKVSYKQIAKWNNIKDVNYLKQGIILKIYKH